jgi:hypothetical protein
MSSAASMLGGSQLPEGSLHKPPMHASPSGHGTVDAHVTLQGRNTADGW